MTNSRQPESTLFPVHFEDRSGPEFPMGRAQDTADAVAARNPLRLLVEAEHALARHVTLGSLSPEVVAPRVLAGKDEDVKALVPAPVLDRNLSTRMRQPSAEITDARSLKVKPAAVY